MLHSVQANWPLSGVYIIWSSGIVSNFYTCFGQSLIYLKKVEQSKVITRSTALNYKNVELNLTYEHRCFWLLFDDVLLLVISTFTARIDRHGRTIVAIYYNTKKHGFLKYVKIISHIFLPGSPNSYLVRSPFVMRPVSSSHGIEFKLQKVMFVLLDYRYQRVSPLFPEWC